MARWMAGVLVLFLVVFSLTALLTGEPGYIIPVLVLALLVVGYAALNWALTRRKVQRAGSLEDAMSDETDPVPSTHIMPDGETALGDTPEAHDEISPHDLPVDHPGRAAAEEEAAENAAAGGSPETRGDEELLREGPADREERLGTARDETAPEGEPQSDSTRAAGTTRGSRTSR